MIDLYHAPTPNGWKAAIMLEETGLAYRPVLMQLSEAISSRPNSWPSAPTPRYPPSSIMRRARVGATRR